jgi:LemA protein
MEHEKSLLEDLTKLRVSALSGAHSTQDKAQLDQKMTAMLKSIMVSVENYPNLKTDSSFKQLQFSLHDIESQLSAARRNFNSMVIDYNNSIEVFPNNLVAPVLGFRSESVFSAPDAEKANPSIGQLLKKSS